LSPPRYRASLPIREIERQNVFAGGPAAHLYPSTVLPRGHGYDNGQRTIPRRFVEDSPELPSRRPFDPEIGAVRHAASTYSESLYEPQYVIDRDGTRYQEIREASVERYRIRHGEPPARGHEFFSSDIVAYMDNRSYSIDRTDRPEPYIRPVPQSYAVDTSESHAQQVIGPSSEYDYRYLDDDHSLADHRLRRLRFDDQEVIYEPVDRRVHPGTHRMDFRRPDG